MSAAKTPSRLADHNVNQWSDCVRYFGDPANKSQWDVSVPVDSGPPRVASPSIRRNRAGAYENPMTSDEALKDLRQKDFNAHKFILDHFSDAAVLRFQNITNLNNPSLEKSSQSRIQTIAENLPFFVNALDSLSRTKEELTSDGFPGSIVVFQYKKRVDAIREVMESFFQGIRQQSKEASNASALLQKIAAYSSLFSLASDIDHLRSTGEFDEISRLLEVSKRYSNLENLSLCSTALKSVEISLRNVEDSLRGRIFLMNEKTFNPKQCKLLMSIQRNTHPILDILTGLDSRVRAAFGTNSLDAIENACQTMEEAIPFWMTLMSFIQVNDPSLFGQYIVRADKNLHELISFAETQAKTILSSVSTSSSTFNPKLHKSVKRFASMWTSILTSLDRPSLRTFAATVRKSSLDQLILNARNDLLGWYTDLILDSFTKILSGGGDSNEILLAYISEFLSSGQVFSALATRGLITRPLMKLYDGIHSSMPDKEDNLISMTIGLKRLTSIQLPKLFELFDKQIDEPLGDGAKQELLLIGKELINILSERLIRKTNGKAHKDIYRGIVGNWADLDSDSTEIKIDGWAIAASNLVIECKAKWKDLYAEMKGQVVAHMAGSILFSIKSLRSLSPKGCARLDLNLNLIKTTVGSIPDGTWKAIYAQIGSISRKADASLDGQKDKELKSFVAKTKVQMQAIQEV